MVEETENGYTAVEKIISRKVNTKIRANEFVEVEVDYAMANDITTLLAIDVMKNQMKIGKAFDPKKIVIILDHHLPIDSVNTAEVVKSMRRFCDEQGIDFYENEGICHQLMIEKYVLPGQIVVGADSHTCSYGAVGALSMGAGSTDLAAVFATGKMWMKVPETSMINVSGKFSKGVFAKDLILKIIGDATADGFTYKVMEFVGELIESLSLPERVTICNMAVEGGAKASFIKPDEKVFDFINSRGSQVREENIGIFESDRGASFSEVINIDGSLLEPMVAVPYTVDNVKPLKDVVGTAIDQVFLGSCTNGRIEDLRIAASVLKGKRIPHGLRMLIVPASVSVLKQAIKEGLINIFLDFGATISHPGCSNCWGASQGILGKNEKQVSTANRNFKGRNGDPSSGTYLVSPATAAASALTGKITDPREFLE